MTVKLIFGSEKIRLILVYGPQEYSSESDKETFWHNIHVEVERAKLAGENLLLIGDFVLKWKGLSYQQIYMIYLWIETSC